MFAILMYDLKLNTFKRPEDTKSRRLVGAGHAAGVMPKMTGPMW